RPASFSLSSVSAGGAGASSRTCRTTASPFSTSSASLCRCAIRWTSTRGGSGTFGSWQKSGIMATAYPALELKAAAEAEYISPIALTIVVRAAFSRNGDASEHRQYLSIDACIIDEGHGG